MSIEAMGQAKAALKELVAQTEGRFFSIKHDHFAMQDARAAIRRLDEEISKLEKEYSFGVYGAEDLNNAWKSGYDNCKEQRQWVGLTGEEINELWAKTGNIVGFGGLTFETIRAVEAKLKEKNGG